MSVKILCNNLSDTEKLAENLANIIKNEGAFICLYGSVGAGKTAFSKFICKYLNVKEKVTSPSFVILNEYKSGIIPVYHFDLYRLENEGISTIISELEEYSEGKILTLVEWAEFSQNSLPFDRIELTITYIDDTKRAFEFTALGDRSNRIIRELNNVNISI